MIGLFLFGGTNVFIRHMAPLYLTNQLQLSIEVASIIFIFMTIIGIFSPTFFTKISPILGWKNALLLIAIILSILFLLLPHFQNNILIVIVFLLLEALFAWPLLAMLQAVLINLIKEEIKDSSSEVLLTVIVCSLVLWSYVFGVIIDFTNTFNYVFYVISVFSFISFLLILLTYSNNLK